MIENINLLEKIGEWKCLQWRGITQSFAMLLFFLTVKHAIHLKTGIYQEGTQVNPKYSVGLTFEFTPNILFPSLQKFSADLKGSKVKKKLL